LIMPAQFPIAAAAVLLCFPVVCAAAEWSGTALSWRIGNSSNCFNVGLLQSDGNAPASLTRREGAQEAYLLYRHTLDTGKLRGAETNIDVQLRYDLGAALGGPGSIASASSTSFGTTSSAIPPRRRAGGASTPVVRAGLHF
jgi:hypothetical protein